MARAVEQYLDSLTKQDWAGLASTLEGTEFERIGPFQDIVSTKDEYVAFLERVVSPLEDYKVVPQRSTEGDSVVYAEVVESFGYGGQKMSYPEVLVFDLTASGLINRVQVYMMRPGEEPPVPGAKA